jgi:hypothetical protein
MSLINEALKKAQRLRNEDAANPSAVSVSDAHSRRGKPDRTGAMVLIGSGALVLVVLSVVFTVYLVNRPAKSTQVVAVTPAPAAKKAPSTPVAHESASTPTIVAPAIVAPAITAPAKDPAPAAPGATSAVQSSAPAASTPTPQPVTVVVPPVITPTASLPAAPAATAPATPVPAPAAALAPDAPDERVAAFVESVRVTGIRSSGAESRVLMNERVYRVNDVVERAMNIRLVKAAPDSLTFADSRGVTYVKRL